MSSRYYETPIGAGMSNLAQAIGSIRGQNEQAGLLASRQALLDEQARTEVQQGINYREQAALNAAKAARERMYATGQQSLSDSFVLPPAAPPSYSIAAGAALPTIEPVPSLADAVSSPIAPQVAAMPRPLGTAPAAIPAGPAPIGALADALAPTPRGIPGQGTGMTPEMAARIAQASALMEKADPAKIVQLYAGSNLATQQPDADLAMSMIQSGAGEDFAHTIRGGLATIDQKRTKAELDAAQRDLANYRTTDANRYRTDVGSGDRRYGYDARSDDVRYRVNNAPSSGRGGGGKTRELSTAQLKEIDNRLFEAAEESGVRLTPSARAQVTARIGERFASGELLPSVIESEAKNMVGDVVPGEKGSWPWSKDKPDTRKFKPPELDGTRAKPTVVPKGRLGSTGKPMPPAATDGAPPPVPRDKTLLEKDEIYTLANGKPAKYLGNGQWDVR
jgi:hypothetical protein